MFLSWRLLVVLWWSGPPVSVYPAAAAAGCLKVEDGGKNYSESCGIGGCSKDDLATMNPRHWECFGVCSVWYGNETRRLATPGGEFISSPLTPLLCRTGRKIYHLHFQYHLNVTTPVTTRLKMLLEEEGKDRMKELWSSDRSVTEGLVNVSSPDSSFRLFFDTTATAADMIHLTNISLTYSGFALSPEQHQTNNLYVITLVIIVVLCVELLIAVVLSTVCAVWWRKRINADNVVETAADCVGANTHTGVSANSQMFFATTSSNNSTGVSISTVTSLLPTSTNMQLPVPTPTLTTVLTPGQLREIYNNTEDNDLKNKDSSMDNKDMKDNDLNSLKTPSPSTTTAHAGPKDPPSPTGQDPHLSPRPNPHKRPRLGLPVALPSTLAPEDSEGENLGKHLDRGLADDDCYQPLGTDDAHSEYAELKSVSDRYVNDSDYFMPQGDEEEVYDTVTEADDNYLSPVDDIERPSLPARG